MKPATIRRFDLLYLAWMALTIVDFFLQRGAYVDEVQAAATGGVIAGSAFVTGVFAVWMLFMLLLWFLVSRKRSTVAKWVIVALVVLDLFGVPSLVQHALDTAAIVGWLTLVVSVVAGLSLFGSGATAWFGRTAPTETIADE